jgi:timeless
METENMETENVETENVETENVETENVEQSYIDPTGGTKCTSDSLPDLRSEDPLAELTVPEEGKVDSNVTELPDTAVETVVSLEGTTQLGGDPSCAGSGEMKGNAINEEEDTSDSSADDCPPATSEADFNVSRLISSLANNSVVQNICWLLRHYKTNSFRTNHYIICMLRRFCEDLELSPMLYQVITHCYIFFTRALYFLGV